MKCNECREALSAYYDKMLDQKQTAAVIAHLEECDACKQEYEQLIKIFGCLKDHQEITVPPLLHQKMLEQVKKEGQKEKVKPLWTHRIGGMVAVLLVGVILIKMNPLEMHQIAVQDESYLLTTSELAGQSEAEETEEVASQLADETNNIQEKEQVEENANRRMMLSEQNAELAVASQLAEDMTMQEPVDGGNSENTVAMQNETDSNMIQAANNEQEVAKAREVNHTQVWQIETEHIDALTKYLEDYAGNMDIKIERIEEDSIGFILYSMTDTNILFNDLQAQSFTKSLVIISEVGENIKIIVKA